MTRKISFTEEINQALASGDSSKIVNNLALSAKDFEMGLEMFEDTKGEEGMAIGKMLRSNLRLRIEDAKQRRRNRSR